MTDKNHFYLEKVFPEPDKIFSFEFSEVEQVAKDAIFVLDTNVLFVPFDSSEKSAAEIKSILKKLKTKKKLFIPARVAREFANNRAKRIGELFLKIRQTKDNLNSGHFKLDDYPILEGNENYNNLKITFSKITELIKESRKELDQIESGIRSWNWNDTVSKMYKEIFTPETIIEVQKENEKIVEDLKFRIEYKIAPGYKDGGKIDDGIGDLIIWTTILEIAKDKKSDVVFVSNDQKNDWFYKQDKIGLYPKYELFDEFRRYTNGKNVHIVSFPKFLELQNAKEETIIEVKETLERASENSEYSRQFRHDDLIVGMQVEHRRFGVGTISKLYYSGSNNEWIQISFENGKIKHFILKFCDIRILDNSYNTILREEQMTSFETSEGLDG